MLTDAITLERPTLGKLARYVAALEAGWGPDNLRGQAAAEEQMAAIAADSAAFVASSDDPEGCGPPIKAPNGELMARLPSISRWVWDGDFCGSIGFRWQPGTADLPAHVLGHIGYATVPWKRGQGVATRALGLILPEAWRLGLPYVDLTTDPTNLASQKVIRANRGTLVGRFTKAAAYGCAEGLRFRIARPAEV